MTTTELAPRAPAAIDRGVLETTEVVSRVHRIQEVMRALMKEDVHYGKIPGTPKPTLYKPGAELLLMTFRIAAKPALIEDLATLDEVRYRVTMRAVTQVTEENLGEAAGECSSSETKYRWVKPVCDEEWDETDPAHRREKWTKGDPPFKVKQVRSSPADVANTILKMAAKRALIAVTLQALAASDIFSQDIEDLDEQLRDSLGEDGSKKPTIKPPKAKAAASNMVQGRIQAIDEKSGTKGGKAWTKYSVKVNDSWHGTFDTKHRDVATAARAASTEVRIEFKTTEYGRDIISIEAVQPDPKGDGTLPIDREPGAEG